MAYGAWRLHRVAGLHALLPRAVQPSSAAFRTKEKSVSSTFRKLLPVSRWGWPGLGVGTTAALRRVCLLAFVIPLLTACASPLFDVGESETVLPVSRAWVDGRMVEYITTDISDLAMATKVGVNHVPRLAAAVHAGPGQSLLERVYKFAGNEQISVFQSAPDPVAANNLDRDYSPLWRVAWVRWQDQASRRELRSEEDVLAAEQRNEVVLEVTDIVVNCPVTRRVGGRGLKGVR